MDGYTLYGYVFFAGGYTGTMKETDEADPFWCSVDEIPYDRMWKDDSVWLPRALEGEKIMGYFTYDGEKALDHKVVPLEDGR